MANTQSQGAIVAWPKKAREIHNHHMDSTIWNDFKFRDGDIIVATYGKSERRGRSRLSASSCSRARRTSRSACCRHGSIYASPRKR